MRSDASIHIVAILAALFWSSAAVAVDVPVKVTPQGGVIQKRVMSMKELKFKNVVRQQTDFSCGAAALATIISYFYDDPHISETEIIEWIIKNGEMEKIKERGFSLLDLKQYAQDKGYKADGYKVKAEQLSLIKIPTIVLLDMNGYSHFVVLKGVSGGKVYIADPSLGNKRIPFADFCDAWNGIVFVVHGKKASPRYVGLDGPIGVEKTEVWSMSDHMMRNLFMNSTEFKR